MELKCEVGRCQCLTKNDDWERGHVRLDRLQMPDGDETMPTSPSAAPGQSLYAAGRESDSITTIPPDFGRRTFSRPS